MPTWFIISTLVIVYISTAAWTLWVNATMLPVTAALAVLRAALWPLWLMGLLRGKRQPMD